MDTAVLPEVRRAGGPIGAEIRGLDLTPVVRLTLETGRTVRALR